MLEREKACSELVSHTPIRASSGRVRMTLNPGQTLSHYHDRVAISLNRERVRLGGLLQLIGSVAQSITRAIS